MAGVDLAVDCDCRRLTVAEALDRMLERTSFSYRELRGEVLVYPARAERATERRRTRGWDQRAVLGWGLAEKSILFNHLAQLGYVVLVVDPRGSEGYGSAHAKALAGEGGGKQADDLVAAARFLGTLGFVEPSAVAIFGHSYGGYLAVQTLVRAPEAFAAGIVLAGVFDYEGRSGAYTRVRFGDPELRAELLRERSPINFVDRLRAPLLLMHGSGDFNVPIGTTEALIDALLDARKDFWYRLYPGEPHFLVGTSAIEDYFRTVVRFLDRHLTVRQSP
jgi:dipeptidyl aminopeptidase/acylaminoacyl peptidase